MVSISILKGKKKGTERPIEVTHHSYAGGRHEKTKRGTAGVKEVLTTCSCCGTPLRHPEVVKKIKCVKCHCTLELSLRTAQTPVQAAITPTTLTPQDFWDVSSACVLQYTNEPRHGTLDVDSKHGIFVPIEDFIQRLFANVSSLNAFCTNGTKELDFKCIGRFYKRIIELPTSRPLYKLLIESNERLKRPHVRLSPDAEPTSMFSQLYWVLMIFENPLLKNCLLFSANGEHSHFLTPQIRAILYEIMKRCVGYLAMVNSATGKDFVSHLQRLSIVHFGSHVDLINLYVTFHFSRILNKRAKSAACLDSPGLDEFCSNLKLNPENSGNDFETIPQMVSKLWRREDSRGVELPSSFKFHVAEYGNDWHVKTAAKLAFFYFVANQCKKKCPVSRFYNSLLDYLDHKKDFEQWRARQKLRSPSSSPLSTSMFEDILMPHYFGPSRRPETDFTMCQHAYLLSLGTKILVMEYETRKTMEYNAEQAFLKALDKKQVIDVYFRMRVRRDYVSQDSLRCIETHHADLKKSLRVEFVNEPGIDAGGLRKEWFLLLTRELFNPSSGLFIVVEESRFSWFNMAYKDVDFGPENAEKLYYLFGIVLGLAIYNGTILDLCFPMALYKKLCGEPLNERDFLELYPTTGKNLIKMMEYDGDDFEDVFCLNFEITYSNTWATRIHRQELCDGGAKRHVTRENRSEYVRLWMDFHMNRAIKSSFAVFLNGFRRVVESDAFKLFTSEELEQLLCGSHDRDIDVNVLKSVAKYGASITAESRIVRWFWDTFQDFNFEQKCKLLEFVTASDRIPATGISTIPFKISKLGGDSEKLPLVHTCFNEICLYDYNSQPKLRHKLILAMNESEGYAFR
ncbi:putative E3 ubiquitin-protein ligase HUL4 [Lachancea thermotolerans CBS 6340]|uniref:HECT-type E3 ubiquitin transferase n=1 Tax=Lachancea thermotolerans (strain ATCC 56472 / CBS 6340 / NRRL Y-8284) TaxID=559295 RepID=C5E3K7_LACTC|nr:KLTH0H14366p [Lachancea thermotolerans CBS 6340]CAR30618.1 KLTH0H14366p [Lachancea thermotolerans CBS 6340]